MAFTEDEVEALKSKNIVDVAQSLGMELVQHGKNYVWKEHDSFSISPQRNIFRWFSQDVGGDVITLVQTMKGCGFGAALNYLNGTEAKNFEHAKEQAPQAFKYYLKDHSNINLVRAYLKKNRRLSDETINYFYNKGLIAQASYKNPERTDGKTEPVCVFKHYDLSGKLVGASIQGIWENRELYPKRGYEKKILAHSDGYQGMMVDVGKVPTAAELNKSTIQGILRIVAFETPLDLMSCFEAEIWPTYQKNQASVRLVSMDGLKKGTISRVLSDSLGNQVTEMSKRTQVLDVLDQATGITEALRIGLAVDNDPAGTHFVENFGIKNIKVRDDRPPKAANLEKMDWNDYLKSTKPLTLNERMSQGKEKSQTAEQNVLQKTSKQIASRQHDLRI